MREISMLNRFIGRDRRRFVIDALKNQSIVGESSNLAEAAYEYAEVIGCSSGSVLIEESAPDNDIFFILSGVVSIQVGGREVAVRSAGQHLGEMAAIDPGQPRSASAVAMGELVVARVSASTFIDLADANPRLWRNIARGLADRLRQRNRFVSPVNPRPVLFVGCSTESLFLTQAIQSTLESDPIVVKVWTDGIFEASEFPIESLTRMLNGVDFAALVLSPDDKIISRGSATDAPRDNIVFELGLFMGALGRSRTFLICPHGMDLKVPTDIQGLTTIRYKPDLQSELSSSISPIGSDLRSLILKAGPR